MKKTTVILLTALVATATFIATSCGNTAGTGDKPTIAVSILPQQYFVTRIAGDLFSINVMIPPGASPATYEPTPAQLASLSSSTLYMKMGYTGFEMAYMDKLRSANKKMTVINLSEGIQLITEATIHGEPKANETAGEHGATGEHGTATGHGHGEDLEAHTAHASTDDHGHHHGGIDPHTWLSPKNVKIIARNIHDALAAAYPEHKEVFAANLEAFLAELDQLDNHIEQELGSLSSRAFFTYHPSLSYFARDYNLEQHPLELGGKTPSAAHMKKLIDKGREEQIGAVFLQMQFDQKNAEVLAREIGAEIIQINPLDPEWYDQMLFITEKLKENLQ
jgi:zinc transport system substrate-binding protein